MSALPEELPQPVDRHRIVLNRARCGRCDDILVSTHVHDYQTCTCGYLSVDGGREYLKRATREGRHMTGELVLGDDLPLRDFIEQSISTLTYVRRGLLVEAYRPVDVAISCVGPDGRVTRAEPDGFVVYEAEGGSTAWAPKDFWANHSLVED